MGINNVSKMLRGSGADTLLESVANLLLNNLDDIIDWFANIFGDDYDYEYE